LVEGIFTPFIRRRGKKKKILPRTSAAGSLKRKPELGVPKTSLRKGREKRDNMK